MTDPRQHLRLSVVTPECEVLQTEADFVVVPAHDGQIGILPGRAPLICKLGIGTLRVRFDDRGVRLFVERGFAEVLNNQVTVLTEQAVPAEQIDSSQVQSQLEQARQMPADSLEAVALRREALRHARALLHAAGDD